MISRRRFLSLTAAAACATPARAEPVRWTGQALGAAVSITIHAPRAQAQKALALARHELEQTEQLFSLYRAGSALVRLNTDGRLQAPDEAFLHLLAHADHVHWATDGVFDPSVQPVWHALANGGDVGAARAKIGWRRVRRGRRAVTLGSGQALTLNGIAQGFATDRVRDGLGALGLTRCLINIGEFAALGGPFRIGLEDPAHGLVATQTLSNRALATSSPAATRIGDDQSHIQSADGRLPLWSTVSVEADRAVYADAASTAFCLMSRREIETALPRLPGRAVATVVDENGQMIRLG